ncbi:MAG: DNA repair protein RadA [Acidimicrobiia bacterium]
MTFACPSCGYRSPKWMGFCPRCRAQEPLVEAADRAPVRRVAAPQAVPLGKLDEASVTRVPSGLPELDRVLGGGVVPGSVLLVGGEPGVGKSTLLLQVAGGMAEGGARVLVATAEESADQVGLRAHRVEVVSDDVLLLAEDDVDRILAAAEEVRPDLLVVDSVQSVGVEELASAPGGVAQVRESAARLIRFAKRRAVATVLVGHVTKEGGIAGPKLLEHMVDVVLYLEGDSYRGFRALRSLKNRFGATHAVGLFEMQGRGLAEVEDPSSAFLADWQGSVPGTVVFPAVDGGRPVLVEIQGLVVPTKFPQARRSVRGLETGRLHQVLAVLERHSEVSFANCEVYVSVAGGLRVEEPGADLPVALALASSVLGRPLGELAAWGEIGLAGEVRPVPHSARRREEAARLGVTRIVAPERGSRLRVGDALLQSGLVV